MIYQRQLSPPQQWAMFLSLFGTLLIFGNFQLGSLANSTSVDMVGAIMVLGFAIWYAGYIVISDRYVPHAGPWVSTMWISIGAAVSFTLVGAATGAWELPNEGTSYLLIFAMILLSTIMALGAFLAGVQLVDPTTASLLSTLEPLFTVFLAIVLLNEKLMLNQFTGGAFILAAVMLLAIAKPREAKSDS